MITAVLGKVFQSEALWLDGMDEEESLEMRSEGETTRRLDVIEYTISPELLCPVKMTKGAFEAEIRL